MRENGSQSTLPSIALVTDESMRWLAEVPGSPLDGQALVKEVQWTSSMHREEQGATLDAVLSDVEGMVFAPWLLPAVPFTPERWAEAASLRVIAGTFDNRFDGWIEIRDAEARGVTVIDTSRNMTPSVAEFALAMTLNLLRDIPAAVQRVRDGGWKTALCWPSPGGMYGDLTGRRIGLAGFGTLNRRYAELIAPFHCAASAFDPFVAPHEMAMAGVESVASLIELASRSEIFAVGIPPTPATKHIISDDVIRALPVGAVVLVMTRMYVVDQDALWGRVCAGELKVAVDVFDPEPPDADVWFRTHPAVLATPHIAGGTFQCHRRCFTTACEDALTVLAGGTPQYAVTIRDDLTYRGLRPSER